MAEFVLILWLPITFAIFASARPPVATAIGLIGGLLLLPCLVGFDLPGFPELDKGRIPSLAAILACAALAPSALRAPRFGSALTLCVVLLLGGGFLTAAMNQDVVIHGPVTLPALAAWDGLSLLASALLDLVVPFYLGWTFHRRPRDLAVVFSLMALAACLYSLLMLFEIRMSPQLHRIVYGFDQFHFMEVHRLGGQRPIVFMPNGLALALFTMGSCVGAIALWKAGEKTLFASSTRGAVSNPWYALPTKLVSFYLMAILVAAKSLAAIVYGAAGALALILLRSRVALRIALLLAIFVPLYPTLRAFDLFPKAALVDAARAVDVERAQSLNFRFYHEDRLLERGLERPWFGWGGYRRSVVFDHKGRDTSVTDGYWVIQIGVRGFVGFFSTFGLLLIPIYLAGLRFRKLGSERDRILVAGTAWILAINAVDLLPNAMLSPVTVFVSGALVGALGGTSEAPRRRSGRERARNRSTAPPRGQPPGADPSGGRPGAGAERFRESPALADGVPTQGEPTALARRDPSGTPWGILNAAVNGDLDGDPDGGPPERLRGSRGGNDDTGT